MKTVTKHDGINHEVKRVSDIEADKLVNRFGYKFCPKSMWKAIRKPIVVKVETIQPETKKKHKKEKTETYRQYKAESTNN